MTPEYYYEHSNVIYRFLIEHYGFAVTNIIKDTIMLMAGFYTAIILCIIFMCNMLLRIKHHKPLDGLSVAVVPNKDNENKNKVIMDPQNFMEAVDSLLAMIWLLYISRDKNVQQILPRDIRTTKIIFYSAIFLMFVFIGIGAYLFFTVIPEV